MRVSTAIALLAAACTADEIIGSQGTTGICAAPREQCGAGAEPDGGVAGEGGAYGGSGGGGGDGGGELGDASYYTYLGAQCELQCPGASRVVADDGFEGDLV